MKGEMRIMNQRGDERLEWDTEVQETVDAVAARFAELLLAGYIPIATTPSDTSRETERLDEFDPLSERIVMIPPMVGG